MDKEDYEILYNELITKKGEFKIIDVVRYGKISLINGAITGKYYCIFTALVDEKMNIVYDDETDLFDKKIDDMFQQFLYKERVRIVSGMYAQGEENE